MGEASGPMLNGSTYIVRPFMQPAKSPRRVLRISKGLTQLLVGPAASLESEQMKVRSSTRATSLASERARWQPGHFFWLSLMRVPPLTIAAHKASYSRCEPSTQWIAAGWQRSAIFFTQRSRWTFLLRGLALIFMGQDWGKLRGE